MGMNESGSLTCLPDPEGSQCSTQQQHRAWQYRASANVGHGQGGTKRDTQKRWGYKHANSSTSTGTQWPTRRTRESCTGGLWSSATTSSMQAHLQIQQQCDLGPRVDTHVVWLGGKVDMCSCHAPQLSTRLYGLPTASRAHGDCALDPCATRQSCPHLLWLVTCTATGTLPADKTGVSKGSSSSTVCPCIP